MTTVNVYLTFDGNCLQAFEFYKSVFGGEFPYVGTFAEMPEQDGIPPIPDEMKDQIMHISLPISAETTLMGSDTGGQMGEDGLVIGNNFSISVTTDNRESAENIFSKLSEDAVINMPLEDTFWGDYFGALTDQFGINWMVSYAEEADEEE